LQTLQIFSDKPSILIMNKIDTLKSKRTLLNSIRTLTNDKIQTDKTMKEDKVIEQKPTAWSKFEDIFMVSSISKNGLQDVLVRL